MAKKTTTKAAKPEVIDTRKTGPLGYKALLLANLAGFSASPEAMDYALNNTDFSYMPQYQSSIEATQDREYAPEELNIGEDIGSSIFDPESYNLYELQNYKDIRAENQPWYALAAAGITKGAILAGTTFVDGTLGLLDGVYTAINEGRWSGIWDNPVTQAMAKINEVAEEELPNYYTQFQQENPLSADSLFSANTVFDKFVKNLGFMVGAAYSGGLYTKGLSLAAKYIGAIKGLTSAAETLGASSKTEAVFKGLGQALKGGKEGGVAAQLMAKGALAMESSNATRATKSVIGSFFNAQAEGTIEAVSNSNDLAKAQKQRIDDKYLADLSKAQEEYQFDGDYAKLMATVDKLNKGRDAAYKRIEEDRKKMGNADLLFNLPILWVGDIATFGKLYAGGWRAARNEAQTVTKATKQALAEAKAAVKAGDKDALKRLNEIVQRAEKTGYKGLSAKEKALVEEVQNSYAGGKLGAYGRAILKGPIKEGNEEMAQGAAAEASGLYYQDDVDNIYNAQVHPEAKQKVLNWMSSIGQGIRNTYGDPNKWEEGFIGAITGALGSPTIGRKTNSTDQTWLGRGKLVGMSGGLFTEIRDQLKDLEGAERTAAHITKTLKDPNFQNRFKHLVAQTHFNDMMEKAVAENSELDFKDAETAAAFEDIMYFKKGNRLDLLKSALANTELFEQEDIDQIVEMTQKQYSAINASINEDLKQVETLTNQLTAANEDYETKFGEEASNKAFLAFLDAGGNSNTLAVQRYNSFIDARNEAEENIKNLQALLDNYLDRINNSTNIILSPYIKVSGDETTMMSADEIKEDIQKRAKKINQIIDDISEALDEIDNTTGGAYTDELLTTLTWYKVRMKDWERRAAAMSGNLKSFIDTALRNPKFALSIEDIEALLSYADELGLSAELRALYGGNIRATKAFLKAGLTIEDILLNLASTLSTDSESGTGNSRYGIALAKYLASDKEIELEKEDGSKIKMPLGKYLLEAIGSFIDADLTYTTDQKEPIKKMVLDLEKIGEAYSKYDKLLDEYKKNPEKIDQAHARIDAANETHITNKAAKTIAERFNWDASIGEIARLLDENEADINNMGGMDKFMNSLNDAQKSKIKQALKLNDAVISLNEVVDESGMDENLKNIAKDLIDKESKEANTVAELASALNDALNEGIIKEMADALLDDDVDERVKDDLLTKAEEQLAELFNTSLSDIAASLDRKEKQQEADRKRQEKIEKEIKEQAEKGELPKEETKEDLPQDLTPPVEQDITPPDDKDLTPPTEPNNDIVIQNGRTKKEAWKPTDNQKLSGGIELGKKGYGNRPQISEYYLHTVDGMSPIDYYTAHPDKIPAGVDKDAFIKYITAVHKFLKARGAFNYVSHQLKPDAEITFELNAELSKDAGVPVVVMKVGDQVIGTIKSQLDFDAYDEAVKKDPNRKDPTVEAQRALYDAIVNNTINTVAKNKLNKRYVKSKLLGNIGEVIVTPEGKFRVTTVRSTTPSMSLEELEEKYESATEEEYNKQHKYEVLINTLSDLQQDTARLIFRKRGLDAAFKYVKSLAKHNAAGLKQILFFKALEALKNPNITVAEAIVAKRILFDKTAPFSEAEISDIVRLINEIKNTIVDEASFYKWYNNSRINNLGKQIKQVLLDIFGSESAIKNFMLNKQLSASTRLIDIGINILKEDVHNEISTRNNTVKTKVKSLMGGTLPISSKENTVSEIFGKNTPIIGWVNSKTGQITTGNVTRDSNVRLPDGRLGGQIYVLIPANNGNLIPALCYSTPINSLDNEDWYMQQAAEALVKCGESIADWGTNANALQKWLPIGDIHINFQYYDDIAKKAVDVDDLGKADRVSINYLDADGKRRYYTLRLKNGVISKTDAIAAIRNIAKDNSLTTNIDKNKLTDTDYINHMSKYLYTNLMVGEQGLHTINDWFTYEQTDIEKKEAAKAKTRKPTSTKNEPRRPLDPKPSTSTVTVNGTEYTMTAEGIVRVNDEIVTDPEIINRVKEALRTSIDKATPIDLGAPQESGFTAFVTGGTNGSSLLGGTTIRGRGRKRGGAKLMSLTKERQLETMSSEALLNQAIEHCKQLFPALADEGRIVIVKGMINAIDTNGDPIQAFGAFKDGILYLSDKAPIGTAYHEAFHYVTAFLLSDFEKKSMFKAAKNKWGNLSEIELEEKLAESFRAFMNGQERMDITQPNKSLLGRIKSIFRKLKDIFNGVLGRELYLDTLFYSIYRGRMTNRTERTSTSQEKFMEASEMEAIKLKAIADGTFMKAPNGNPTNLNERQWLQVRTKAFKDWFGDWENNPENASKVVDENGEPLVVYHGGSNTKIFDTSGNRHGGAGIKKGIKGTYFTTSKNNARFYEEIYNFKISEQWIAYADELREQGASEEEIKALNEEFENEKPATRAFFLNIKNPIKTYYYGNKKDGYVEKSYAPNKSDGQHIKIEDKKYEEYVATNPNQIKSATDNIGTFDANNPDIRFMKADTFKQELLVHRANKVAYDNLSQEEKEYLALRKVSEKDYEALNTDQKEILLHCM